MLHLTRVVFVIGSLLLGLNVVGLIWPNDQRSAKDVDGLTYDEATQELLAVQPHMGTYKGVESVAKILHQASARSVDSPVFYVPARQNWILFLLGQIDIFFPDGLFILPPNYFSHYQMLDHRKALMRATGQCSQWVLIMAGLFDELGFNSDVVNLGGHLVLQIHLPGGGKVIGDPLYGVAFPFAVEDAPKFMADLKAAYAGTTGEAYVELYDAANNITTPGGVRGFNPKGYWVEMASYWLIWIIPVCFLLPFCVIKVKRR